MMGYTGAVPSALLFSCRRAGCGVASEDMTTNEARWTAVQR
jgi:hypothetical protein